MNIYNAQELCKQGLRITHHYFSDNEYIEYKNGAYYFEDGVKVPREWWDDDWKQDDWEVKQTGEVVVHEDPRYFSLKDMAAMEITKQMAKMDILSDFKPKPIRGTRVDVKPRPTVKRNDSCPCNSGKKYKKCCINK